MWIRRIRWWRALLVTALAVIGLVLVASWVIVRRYGPAFTRERVEALISETVGLPARLAAVRLSPWRGRVSLIDLEVGSRQRPGGPALRAAAIDVSIDVASLWRRQLVLSALVTDLRVDATVSAAADGTGSSPFPLPTSFEVGPVRISVGRIRVSGGDVVIRAPEAGFTVELEGSDLTARLVGEDADVSGSIRALRFDVRGRREQLDGVALESRLSADLVTIRRLAWRWHGQAMRLEADARHPWVEQREVSVRLAGDVALAAIARLAGSDQRIDGAIRLAATGHWGRETLRLDDLQVGLGTARVQGRLEAAARDGVTRLSLDLREVLLPGALTALGAGTAVAEARVADGGIDVTRADARWRGVSLSLSGRIGSGQALAAHARLTADLKEVSSAGGLDSASGHATVEADLTGRGQAPAVEGWVRLGDLVAYGRALQPVEASFRLAAAPGSSSRWEGTVQSARIGSDQLALESLTASLAVDGRRLELIRASARAASVPLEGSGAWEWSGSGRGRVELGPVSLRAIAGVPATLRLDGTGQATADIAVDRGVATTSVQARLDRASVAGVALGDGQASIRARGLVLDAALAFPERRLRARAGGRLEADRALTATLELDDLALQPLLRELGSGAADHVEGRLSGRGEASIPIGEPAKGRGVARLTLEAVRLLGAPWTSPGPIVLRWEGPRVLVESLRLDGPTGRFSATGALVGADGRGLSLALDDARLPGGLADVGLGRVQAEVGLDGADVQLDRLDAQWPGLRATASGRLHGDGAVALTGRLEAETARLARPLGVAGIDGRATLTIAARGRTDAIEATGLLRAPRIEVRGASLDDVELPLTLTRSSLRLENGRARLGQSRISVEGSASWPRTAPLTADTLLGQMQIEAELRAPATRLEDVAPLLPASAHGRGELALGVRAEGTPRAWRATGILTSPLVEIAPGPLRQLRVPFALDDTRLDVTDLSVDAFGVPVRASASWAWTGGGSAKATLGPAPLASLAPRSGLEGTARATIDVAGSSPPDVSGTASATLDAVSAGGVRLGRGKLDLSARRGALRAELAFPSAHLQASARGRVDATGILGVEATVQEVDLARLAGSLEPGDPVIGGAVAAHATLRVPLAEPSRGDGALTLDPVRLSVTGHTWESQRPVVIRWAAGQFSLEGFRLVSKEGFVDGQAILGADGKLDARASARVPLDGLEGVRPEIREIGGALEVSLRATGTMTAPVVVGDGAVRRGNLLLRDRPDTLRDVEARFALSRQGLQVKEATASLGGGRIQAQGDLALQGWQPGAYRFRLQAKEVAVGQIEGFSSAWDADLELSGITREAQLTGRARLVRGAYRRDLSILSLVLSPARAVAVEPGTPLRLRVRVDLDDNMVVRSRSADLRVGGTLTVEGTTAKPVIFGTVESRDGHINFRGRSWTVTSATVRFADPRRLDPYLDVVATSRIAEYDVTMQVVGPVSSIAVRFTSTPRLSNNDLLSLVAFGATGSTLRESPAAVLLGEAGKMVAQNVLGVDPSASGLRVTTGSTTDNPSQVHGFPADDRAPAPRTTPGERKDTVRLEYQLWAPLYLSGEYDRQYGYGADVVLRFRFR